MSMTIKDLQQNIEESLGNLPEVALPMELEGLRNLPVSGFRPKVSIYYAAESGRGRKRRKVRETASASYFDPEICELVIGFDPIPESQPAELNREVSLGRSNEYSDGFDVESATDSIVDALKVAESMRPFVGLKWFRDQFLGTECNEPWARDQQTTGKLLGQAIEDDLIRTSRVPNPNSPLYPTTAIRLNRKHPRLGDAPVSNERSRFSPVRIRGGMASDTVIQDRADRY